MDIYEELSDMLRVPVAIVNNISTQMAVNAGQMVKQKYESGGHSLKAEEIQSDRIPDDLSEDRQAESDPDLLSYRDRDRRADPGPDRRQYSFGH